MTQIIERTLEACARTYFKAHYKQAVMEQGYPISLIHGFLEEVPIDEFCLLFSGELKAAGYHIERVPEPEPSP